MKNRRRYKRFPLAGAATLRYKVKEENQTIHAVISDISFGGIRLYLDTPLANNTNISIDVTFIDIDGTMRTETIEGRTVYAKEIKSRYFTGIEFNKECDLSKQPFLYEHISNISVF